MLPQLAAADGILDTIPILLADRAVLEPQFPDFWVFPDPAASPEPDTFQLGPGAKFQYLRPFDTLNTCEGLTPSPVPSETVPSASPTPTPAESAPAETPMRTEEPSESAVAGLHGGDLVFSEYRSDRAGTLGLGLRDFRDRWNRETKPWPELSIKRGLVPEEAEGGGREFYYGFPGLRRPSILVAGYVDGDEIGNAIFMWEPSGDRRGRDSTYAHHAIRAFVVSSNPGLSGDDADELVSALGWRDEAASYVGIENQVTMNGMTYTLVGYEGNTREVLFVVAQEADPSETAQE